MAMSRVFSASDPQCLYIDNTPSDLLVSTRLVGLRSKTSLDGLARATAYVHALPLP